MLSFLQKLTSPAPRESLLLNLLPELLEEIVEWLPTADRACLALTCKYFFFRYCSVHKAPELHSSRPVQGKKPILCANAEKQLPCSFLRRLENSRWKFCLECWKLHPRTKRQLPWRYECSECHLLHGGRCVMDAGVVDICPCLSITYRDLLRLIGTVRGLEDCGSWDDADTYCEEALSRDSYHGVLAHQCQITDHPNTKAEISTKIFFGDEGNLIVQNDYLFKSFKQTSEAKHTSTCPHGNTVKWLQSFLKDAGSGFAGYRNVFRDHFPCVVSPIIRKSDGESFEVAVKRDLGKGKVNDKNWRFNRRSDGLWWDQKLW